MSQIFIEFVLIVLLNLDTIDRLIPNTAIGVISNINDKQCINSACFNDDDDVIGILDTYE